MYGLRRQAGRQAKIMASGGEKDWRDYLDVILDLISNMGEMASVNTNAARYEAGPAPLGSAKGLHPPTKRRPRSRTTVTRQTSCCAIKGTCVVSPGVQ